MPRTGPDDDFATFFAAENDGLRRFAYFLTGNLEEAADLAQEALARVYLRWKNIRDDPAPYTRKTLVNLWKNSRRRLLVARRSAVAGTDIDLDHAIGVDETIRLTGALSALPMTQRAAIVLRYYEDRPISEVARILGRPEGTVKSDLHRALAKLRPLLEEETP